MEQLIERILNHLNNFQNDTVFQTIKEQLLRIIKDNNVSLENIRIFLGTSFSNDEYLATNDLVTIVRNSSNYKGYTILISFEDSEYSYNFETISEGVELSGYRYDSEETMYYELYSYQNKDGEKKLINRKDIIDRNDYFLDSKIDIFYFDVNGNLLNKDAEEEKDKMFSKEFDIPLAKARFYRTHFVQFRKYINECKTRSEMSYEDNNPDNNNLFCPPFELENIKDTFQIDLDDEEKLSRAFDFNYTMEDLEEAVSRLETIRSTLASQIGFTGKIVLSNNLFWNIASYIFNSSSTFLLTTGTIIKKENGEYVIYYIAINSNEITTIPKLISKEEVQTIYYSNEGNEQIEGLKEFFEVERNRR